MFTPTFNGYERDGKTPTYGGYSTRITVNEDYVLENPRRHSARAGGAVALRWHHQLFAA